MFEEIRLFQPDLETGVLGYVNHSYNKRNMYKVLGNYFIGVAPIVACFWFQGCFVLYYLLMYCTSYEFKRCWNKGQFRGYTTLYIASYNSKHCYVFYRRQCLFRLFRNSFNNKRLSSCYTFIKFCVFWNYIIIRINNRYY